MRLAQKFNFKVNVAKLNYVTNLKEVEKYDFQGITRTNCFKYLGVLISARGSIENHRKMAKKKVEFLYNQLISLNRFLPIRHMTQLWNSFIKPHFDYVAPLMRHFSSTHLIKWQKIYRYSIKTLQFPQHLPNEELYKIWKQFWFRPSAILQYTAQQTIRFREELKRTKQPLSSLQLLRLIDDFQHEEAGLRMKQSEINYVLYKMKEDERLIKSNLKIKYIPNKDIQRDINIHGNNVFAERDGQTSTSTCTILNQKQNMKILKMKQIVIYYQNPRLTNYNFMKTMFVRRFKIQIQKIIKIG